MEYKFKDYNIYVDFEEVASLSPGDDKYDEFNEEQDFLTITLMNYINTFGFPHIGAKFSPGGNYNFILDCYYIYDSSIEFWFVIEND